MGARLGEPKVRRDQVNIPGASSGAFETNPTGGFGGRGVFATLKRVIRARTISLATTLRVPDVPVVPITPEIVSFPVLSAAANGGETSIRTTPSRAIRSSPLCLASIRCMCAGSFRL